MDKTKAIKPKVVKIQRGKYGADFQLIRALLSAASACLHANRRDAIHFIDRAIKELMDLRVSMSEQA